LRIRGIVVVAENVPDVALRPHRGFGDGRVRCGLLLRSRDLDAALLDAPKGERCEGDQEEEWSRASSGLDRRARIEPLLRIIPHRFDVGACLVQKQTPGSASDPGALRDDCSSAPLDVTAASLPSRPAASPNLRAKGQSFGRSRTLGSPETAVTAVNAGGRLFRDSCVGAATGQFWACRLPAATLAR
jgi:hypothetical protein